MNTRAFLLSAIFASAALVSAAPREWTSAKGTKLQAEFQKVESDFVFLKMADGSLRKIQFDALSEADKKFVADAALSSIAEKPPSEPDGERTPRGPDWRRGPGSRDGGPGREEGGQTFECASDPQTSYTLYLPSDFKAGRVYPVLLVVPGRGEEWDLSSRLGDVRSSFPGLVVAPRSSGRWGGGSETGTKQLRAIETDLATRYKTDPARLLLAGFGEQASAVLDYATADRARTMAAVVLVETSLSGVTKAPGNKTAMAGVCPASSSSRGEMARFFAAQNGNNTRLFFHSRDRSAGEALADAVLWAYATRLKLAADATLTADRDALARQLLARAAELADRDKERAYEYVEMAVSAAASAPAQSEAGQRLGVLGRDAVVAQYVGARRDLDRLVEKYIGRIGWGPGRRFDWGQDFQKDIERMVERYPATSIKSVLRQLSASSSDWRGPPGPFPGRR